MITDATGAEIRPTLHVPFRDYQALLDENKRLRAALETERKYWIGVQSNYQPEQVGYRQAQRKLLSLDAALTARLSKP